MTGLSVVDGAKGDTWTDRTIGEVHVHRRVDVEMKRREVDKHPAGLIVAEETATPLHHVGPEAVQRLPQVRDV